MLAFGHNIHGQLGVLDAVDATTPTAVRFPDGGTPWHVGAGPDVTVVITTHANCFVIGPTQERKGSSPSIAIQNNTNIQRWGT